jgi:Pentapeptide repeats (9 copies)
MAKRTEVEWPRCKQAGCIGIRLVSARMCLAHASEEDIAAALKLVAETGAIDARGVPVTRALLERILTAAPRGKNEEPLISGCRFDEATFTGDAVFDEVTITGDALFNEATFTGYAGFARVTFCGSAWFAGATFSDGVLFDGATFSGDAMFNKAMFMVFASFDWVTFGDSAAFFEARFRAEAAFLEATFHGGTGFDGVTFSGGACFCGTIFSDSAGFGGAIFNGTAEFDGARFEQARQLGPLLACRGLVLDNVQFAQPVQIEVSSTGVCCRGARFAGGVQFRLRWARVVLDDADLAAPSILAGVPHLSTAEIDIVAEGRSEELARREEQIARAWRRLLADDISERPQLVSLRRANVAGLGLSNVSAADCRFDGAHNLDKLRLEADVSFAAAPLPLGLGGRRWGGREVIAEERAWRASRSRRRWVAPRWPGWLDDQLPGVLAPGQIAALYRALRKGREDVKDEPGAADFYYGEMEMRRAHPLRSGAPHGQSDASSRGQVERGILTAYWLVSGYGLRAWRAVVCLAVVTALLAVAFHLVGFAVPPHPVSYWTSLLYAFRATLSLTDDEVKLTAWGQLLQGVLRLTGPVLLGLALLALRGRVKR